MAPACRGCMSAWTRVPIYHTAHHVMGKVIVYCNDLPSSSSSSCSSTCLRCLPAGQRVPGVAGVCALETSWAGTSPTPYIRTKRALRDAVHDPQDATKSPSLRLSTARRRPDRDASRAAKRRATPFSELASRTLRPASGAMMRCKAVGVAILLTIAATLAVERQMSTTCVCGGGSARSTTVAVPAKQPVGLDAVGGTTASSRRRSPSPAQPRKPRVLPMCPGGSHCRWTHVFCYFELNGASRSTAPSRRAPVAVKALDGARLVSHSRPRSEAAGIDRKSRGQGCGGSSVLRAWPRGGRSGPGGESARGPCQGESGRALLARQCLSRRSAGQCWARATRGTISSPRGAITIATSPAASVRASRTRARPSGSGRRPAPPSPRRRGPRSGESVGLLPVVAPVHAQPRASDPDHGVHVRIKASGKSVGE